LSAVQSGIGASGPIHTILARGAAGSGHPGAGHPGIDIEANSLPELLNRSHDLSIRKIRPFIGPESGSFQQLCLCQRNAACDRSVGAAVLESHRLERQHVRPPGGKTAADEISRQIGDISVSVEHEVLNRPQRVPRRVVQLQPDKLTAANRHVGTRRTRIRIDAAGLHGSRFSGT
jgi:hypothetical protein